ncbi:MAG: hypothetical protein Q8R61_05075 [Thiobacillus sp.]|uniref:hypothetical protein n=1 Tax=Thiobacillus sp. TaxID=924 RepID=UPI002733A712|nr:hypothetical protein [Thiobacillus sp.]MDP3584476.1 hypothetical protein [Thiobacillus sp.]
MMDLSHWDLVDEFSMREAACLAGGIEPLVYAELPVERRAKADLIYRQISVGYATAESAVSFSLIFGNRFDSGETLGSVFSGFSFPLPSTQLVREVEGCLRMGRAFNSTILDDAPSFSRQSLGDWFNLKGFHPIYKFAQTSMEDGREEQSVIQSPSREHVSDKLAKLNQAAAKFWANADRDDRGTHPDNAKVTAWLVDQGFSPTLADKAATIIRPEWAPTGRKPED